MRLDRMMTLWVTRPLLSAGLAASRRTVPVLMYHSISGDPETGVAPYYKTATNPAVFEEQIRFLTDQGYQSVDVAEAFRLLNTKVPTATKPVVITFDDGFRDFHDVAFPILKKYRQTAVVYLPSAFIDGSRRSFKGRECLTWSEVRELRGQGIRFGSHTVSHPKLYELSWKEIEEELANSKERIERELGEEVSGFAYPFAFPQQDRRFTDRFIRLLRQRGYGHCCTTVIGRPQPGDDPFCVKRLPVNVDDDRALFAAKLAGAYDWFGRPQSWAKAARHRFSPPPAAAEARSRPQPL
jgi:peptidoglycan/xylan/chitin deacetylase (PgdA/CDA1 family)